MLTSAGGKRGVVVGEDGQDESQLLEQELLRLQRQLHVMEGDRRSYLEESCNLLRKRRDELLSLRAESEEIQKVLSVSTDVQNTENDRQTLDTLMNQMDQLDKYQRQCVSEEREIKDVENQLSGVKQMIREEKKVLGGVTEETVELLTSKRLRVTQNRLNQELIKFNIQMAKNARLREELDHLRQEKSVFDAIHKRLRNRLENNRKQIVSFIAQAIMAYEERDEAQTKMNALKERFDKDVAQQEIDVKEVLRKIKHNNKLKEFMGIKAQDRSEFKEEEMAKARRGRDSSDREVNHDMQAIRKLKKAFKKIQQTTGNDDTNRIVNDFIKQEETNFAMYNYVNELNDTTECMLDEINRMESELAILEAESVAAEEERRKLIREMEIKAEQLSTESDDIEAKNVVICKTLDEIRAGIQSQCKTCGCDCECISGQLGSEMGITNKNITQHMGNIERFTTELLAIQNYQQMLKRLSVDDPKETQVKGQLKPPVIQRKLDSSIPVAIIPPSTGDDDDVYSTDTELRPLTREEIKTTVLKKVGKKLASMESILRVGEKKKQNKPSINNL